MEYPGEKLVIRLWETVTEKGVGGLVRPWQMRREGRARADVRRDELLSLAQTAQDVKDIQSGRKSLAADHQLVESPEQASPLALRNDLAFRDAAASVYRNRIAQELRGEVNVGKALLHAEAELEDNSQPPPERKVDDDWLFRWRDAASTVSSEELQILWGRVLAGEVKSPGSCSLRTLEFLKNLSHEEALQIAKLSRFVIDNDCIASKNKQLLDSEGITFGFLHGLQNLGIIGGMEAIGITLTIGSLKTDTFQSVFVSHGRALIVTHEDASKKIKLKVYCLTLLGKQIFRLGSFEPHEIYLQSVGQDIRSQGFKVLIGRCEQVTEERGRYFEARELDGEDSTQDGGS